MGELSDGVVGVIESADASHWCELNLKPETLNSEL
jgi:hypothetical protein